MQGGIVKLIDINDYITPNQSCIKSLAETVKGKKGNKVKKITLDDCLSCTGCITSSEALLINNFTLDNHFSLIKDNYKNETSFKLGIISYQALESFLIVYKQIKKIQDNNLCYYNEIANIIAEILNIDFILPLNDFILYTLNIAFNEFMEKKEKGSGIGIISTECPGWVCYAEKKIGKISFEHMSNIKSPHELSAIIIKALFEKFFNYINNSTNNNKTYSIDKNLYICSIMSCFDKKIEPIKNKIGINTVISTIELEEKFKEFLSKNYIPKNRIINIEIMKKYLDLNKSIKDIKELIDKEINNNNSELINLSLYNFIFKENYSSNFYIEYFIYRIKNLNNNCYLERNPGKNIDSKEILIYNNETKSEILYKFLISYGLRNIQNIVRMIKSNKMKYDYIELMDCPGGCINGAGQIRVEKNRDEIFNEINNGFNYFKEEKLDIDKSINEIEKIICELNIDKNQFRQTFKEADFSKSDIDW